MTENRFENIETKLAHQEALLLELNDVVAQQQASITKLEALCDSLRARVRVLSDTVPADTPEDEAPPHY